MQTNTTEKIFIQSIAGMAIYSYSQDRGERDHSLCTLWILIVKNNYISLALDKTTRGIIYRIRFKIIIT